MIISGILIDLFVKYIIVFLFLDFFLLLLKKKIQIAYLHFFFLDGEKNVT